MAIALPGAGAVEIDGATVVAQVNGEPILASDLLPSVNWLIAKNIKRIKPDEVPAARQFLLQQRLESTIMLKLLSAEARRSIPAKGIEQFESRITEYFFKDEVPALMKEYEAQSRAQLELQLRKLGTSLEREKKAWSEKVLAQQWLASKITDEKEVTHPDLLAYYHENTAEFQFPSRARWEQLSVGYGSRFTRDEARQRIAWMGDQVLRGVPFAEVAKRYSDGLTAAQGGQKEWTTRGGLASEVLDQALFSLPVGRLSPILEDRGAFHIIRVIEREEAGQTAFFDAQDKIKKALANDDKQQQREDFLKGLREKATVWTIFDSRPSVQRVTAQPQPAPR